MGLSVEAPPLSGVKFQHVDAKDDMKVPNRRVRNSNQNFTSIKSTESNFHKSDNLYEMRKANRPRRSESESAFQLLSRRFWKMLGRRREPQPTRDNIDAIQKLLGELRGRKPFLSKEVCRFKTHEEAGAWEMKMLTRPPGSLLPDR